MTGCAAPLLVLALFTAPTPAEEPALRLPWVFADHMVLQRDRAIRVWGDATPGAEVAVVFAGEEGRTRSDARGRWQLELPPREASAEGRELRVQSGEASIVLEDVLVGEVWLCAGQSNMDFPLRRANGGEEATGEVQPRLRLCDRNGVIAGSRHRLTPAQLAKIAPDRYYRGCWKRCDADSALSFSAVGYFFGRKLAGERVELESPEVPEPVAARYAWAPFPTCSLVNGAGLPAAPFRTPASP